MDYKIIDVEGIGPVYAEKLEGVGIKTSGDLLEKGKNTKGRRELAEKTGISGKRILTWVNHADLYRINGIGPQFAELLEASGVDTVLELALRNPVNLERKLKAVNEVRHLTRRVPSVSELEKMIAQAKELPRVVTYGRVKNSEKAEPKKSKTVNANNETPIAPKTIESYDSNGDGKWSFKDQNGNWMEVESMVYDFEKDEYPMVLKFEEITDYYDYFLVREREQWGVIDREGNWLLNGFDCFEDEDYPCLILWQDGDEWHLYPDGRITMACMEEDDDEVWDEDDEEWEDED